jgi:hypothetical protein
MYFSFSCRHPETKSRGIIHPPEKQNHEDRLRGGDSLLKDMESFHRLILSYFFLVVFFAFFAGAFFLAAITDITPFRVEFFHFR